MKAGAQCHGLWVANYGNQQTKLRPWNRDQMCDFCKINPKKKEINNESMY